MLLKASSDRCRVMRSMDSRVIDCYQPEAAVHGLSPDDSFWPTDDSPHPLTAYPKPDARGAAPKVRFVVLRSQVARPGFGEERS